MSEEVVKMDQGFAAMGGNGEAYICFPLGDLLGQALKIGADILDFNVQISVEEITESLTLGNRVEFDDS